MLTLCFRSARREVAGASLAFKPAFNRSTLVICNKLLKYISCIIRIPIMTYVSLIWGFTCKFSKDILSKLYNKHLRIARNASRYLRNTTICRDVNAPAFRKRAVDLSSKFYESLYNLINEIIAKLPDYDAIEPDHLKRPKYFMIMDVE